MSQTVNFGEAMKEAKEGSFAEGAIVDEGLYPLLVTATRAPAGKTFIACDMTIRAPHPLQGTLIQMMFSFTEKSRGIFMQNMEGFFGDQYEAFFSNPANATLEAVAKALVGRSVDGHMVHNEYQNKTSMQFKIGAIKLVGYAQPGTPQVPGAPAVPAVPAPVEAVAAPVEAVTAPATPTVEELQAQIAALSASPAAVTPPAPAAPAQPVPATVAAEPGF